MRVRGTVRRYRPAGLRQPVRLPPPASTRFYRLTDAQRRRRAAGRVAWKATRTVGVRSYKHRMPLAPVYVTAALFGAAVGLHAAHHGPGTVPVVMALPVGLVWRRSRKWDEKPRWYGRITVSIVYVWLQTAAIVGATRTPMPGLLGFAALAAAVPWWWWHRHKTPDPDPEPTGPDRRVLVWQETVAGQGGALPGAVLTGVKDTDIGWTATVELPPGKLTIASAVAAQNRIASAYRKPAPSIVVEATDSAIEGVARLEVIDRNPLQTIQPFTAPGLDRATGRFPIGPYVDGGLATWKLWTPGSGACHGLICGTQGSGKSRLVDHLCVEVRHSGLAVLWIGDPQGGESVPDWQDCPDRDFWFAASVDEIRDMLLAAERIMVARQDRRRYTITRDEKGRDRRGKGKFDPTPEEPLLSIVLDEAHAIMADPECCRIVKKIAQTGRKLGVGVNLVTQVPSLSELGGGDGTVRAMLATTNVVVLRTADRYSKTMAVASDFPVNPSALPESWQDGSSTAGLGFVANSQRYGSMRDMLVDDPYEWAMRDATVAELEESARRAAGDALGLWRERREQEWLTVSQPVTVTTVQHATAVDASGTVGDRIVVLLGEHGKTLTGVLARALGNPPLSTVSTALGRLQDRGLVHQVRRGEWELAR